MTYQEDGMSDWESGWDGIIGEETWTKKLVGSRLFLKVRRMTRGGAWVPYVSWAGYPCHHPDKAGAYVMRERVYRDTRMLEFEKLEEARAWAEEFASRDLLTALDKLC